MTNSVYIIAEAGVNHNGSIDNAIKLIDIAAEAGANAVKFQTFNSAELVQKEAKKANYQIANTGSDESQLEMLKKLELNEEAHQTLLAHARLRDIDFLSTPFDIQSLEMLTKKFDLAKVKIPSGEITNAQILLEAARTNLPVILSTGMSTLGEIEDALSVLAYGYMQDFNSTPSSGSFKKAYASSQGQALLQKMVTLLHCTTEYPAPFEDVNLNVLQTLKKAFSLKVGYSDHTSGISVSIAAVAMGAELIEKHFTIDKSMPGPDHKASLAPDELKNLVQSIREVEAALGIHTKFPAPSEFMNKEMARKSLVAKEDIKKGQVFSTLNLTAKRPGHGTSPMMFWDLIGRISEKDYYKDELI